MRDLANGLVACISVHAFAALGPGADAAHQIALHHLCQFKNLRVFLQPGLCAFAFRNIGADGDVLPRLSIRVQARNDRAVDPVKRPVFGAVANLPMPDLTPREGAIHLLEELLRVAPGVEDAMILPEQFLARVLTD